MPTDNQPGSAKVHCLRLLLPFFFERNRVAMAARALAGLRHEGKRPWPCWALQCEPHDLYRQETLPGVRAFLFGDGAPGDRGGCGYLRVPAETADLWFKRGGTFLKPGGGQGSANATCPPSRPDAFEVTLAAPGIELFISPHGAGVLSLAFEFEASQPGGHDLMVLRDLGYRLSQLRPYTSFAFQLPHGERNPNPPPASDAPLGERLGQAGGAFRLAELVDFLLAPLKPLGHRAMQEQFSVFSVTRFGLEADFSDPAVRESLHPFLAALAHLEECAHPGSLATPEQVLNPRHWAAASSLAAVHLVADQDPPHPYDEQRVPTVLHKYFVPYLVTLLQRIALQRLLGEARTALVGSDSVGIASAGADPGAVDLGNPGAGLATRLRELNGQALAFTVNGCFTEVSAREAHNQYYELVQTGLRVRDSFGTVQQALRDAEAMENDRFQGDTLNKIGTVADKLEALVAEAGHNARLVAHVQSKVEWLEVFFVSYYFTALMYYVGHGGLFTHKYTVITLVLAPLVSGAIAFVGLKPHRLHRASGHTTETQAKPSPRKERTWWFLLLLISTFVLWLGVGLRFFPGEGLSHGGEHPPAAATEHHDTGQH